jgi:CRP-like cAMP-binding protein
MTFPPYIRSIPNLSEQTEQEISSVFKREVLPRGHFLYRAGEVCHHIYYVETGLARVYYNTLNGKEITQWFFPENSFLTAVDCFYNRKPTMFYGELLEDSVVYSIRYAEMEAMLSENHEMAQFAFHAVYALTRKLSEYITGIKFQSAEDRYNALMKDYPGIFQRVKLGHIASFLGITQETLSRIRAGK